MTRQNFPRSPKALLGGIAHLGRFIDKIRLRNAGHIQDYNYITVGFDKYLADFLAIDAKAFEQRVLAGGTDEELLAFVNAHRATNEELGFTGGEDDCPIDELIPEYLAISFKGNDIVHFGMDGMPNVVVACASDLFDAPIFELGELLTTEAIDYFPALKD